MLVLDWPFSEEYSAWRLQEIGKDAILVCDYPPISLCRNFIFVSEFIIESFEIIIIMNEWKYPLPNICNYEMNPLVTDRDCPCTPL